ncbi:calpastatin isoform x2 [Limosa lapponica baueri]|uniref:Calpastatin n=1 Tax=Limosa lapponica baueri TaxID=1758121 RepID=A0A2I0TFD3_LIMLA|nr:calpastatin isoform x2 [Limosa lapponica baueri]
MACLLSPSKVTLEAESVCVALWAAMDESALDSLIDTLGEPEEDVPPSPVYTGPEVTEDISSRYLEEMGKREGSLPPEYVKLLKEIKEDAVEALLDTLGGPEPEPEKGLTPVVEVSEVKAKEKKEEKTGERDDTIPPEYRLTPELDKDGKPILPKPEEKPKEKTKQEERKKLGEDEETIPPEYRLTGAKDKDGKPLLPKPEEKPQGGKEMDEALDLLSDSLGQREPDPDENKPVVDKVKKPRDDSAAIDALSGDFDTCAKPPATPQPSKDKSGKETVTTKPAPKDKGKPKDPKKVETTYYNTDGYHAL